MESNELNIAPQVEVAKVEPIALAVEPETIPTVVAAAAPEAEVVATPTADLGVAAEAPAPKKVKNTAAVESSIPADVFVSLASLKCGSRAKNSRSVRAVQTRLIELGFSEAGNDNYGTFGEGTCSALHDFKKDSNITSEGCADKETIEALLKGTKAEVVD